MPTSCVPMTCHRARDVDLHELLVIESSQDLDDFRAHYPTCPACAAEVAAWTALHLSLRGGSGELGEHPAPDALLKFEQEPDALAAQQREAIESHLRSCRSCADESRALAGFDFDRVREQTTRTPQGISSLARSFALLKNLALRPAFAYGIAVVALLPAVALYLSNGPAPDATHRGLGAPPEGRRPPAIEGTSQPVVLELIPPWQGRGGEPTLVLAGSTSRETHLSISVPVARIPDSQVEVRIVGPDEHRQLIQRSAWTEPLQVTLPSAWLKPGRYTVRVQPIGAGEDLPALPMYGFVVR